jgi:hypothetical protein
MANIVIRKWNDDLKTMPLSLAVAARYQGIGLPCDYLQIGIGPAPHNVLTIQ